jgi:hypothetical protein
MGLMIQNTRAATPEEWGDASARCGYATYFHTPGWARIMCAYAAPRLTPDARLVRFSDGAAAVVPLCRLTRGGIFTEHISTPGGNFGGWVSGDALEKEHVELLVGHLSNLGNVFWRENPYAPHLAGTAMPGARDDFTQAIDLREGFDAVYRKWSRGHVNAVNKARRLGVTVRRGQGIDDWRRHYECYRGLRRRWLRPRTDFSWKLFDVLRAAESDNVVLWCAEQDGMLLSSAVCFYWNHHAVAWHGAAAADKFTVRSNHYMYHEIIRHAAEAGFHWFDMNPSAGNPGVADFKAHLGAEKLTSRIVIKRTGILRLLLAVRRLGGG